LTATAPVRRTGELEAVAVAGSVNLVDWFDLEDVKLSHQAVKGGDRTSAAIAAASIVAKVTRDQVMVELDKEYPGYGFAVHKGYGTPGHAKAIIELGHLSPAHRQSVRSKAYAALETS
jgi:ribonuclease HII